MTEILERIVYCSHATVENADTVSNLIQILAVSQRNNARDDITGALAVTGNRYFQIIEGSRGSVDALLQRISRDRRHDHIAIVERRWIPTRRFGEWAMVAPVLTPEITVQIGKAVDECHHDPDKAIDLLRAIVVQQHEAGQLIGG